MTIQLLDHYAMPPYKCALTGATEGRCVDLGINVEPETDFGPIYVSEQIAKEIGLLVGMVKPEDMTSAWGAAEALGDELTALRIELANAQHVNEQLTEAITTMRHVGFDEVVSERAVCSCGQEFPSKRSLAQHQRFNESHKLEDKVEAS
jgi:hypothetical protein